MDTQTEMVMAQADERARRGSWWDLALYFAVFVAFVIASVVIAFAFSAIPTLRARPTLLTTFALGLNFVFFAGGAYLVGACRGRFTLAEIGLWPIRWNWLWLLIAIGLSVVFIPLRMMIGVAVQYLVEGNLQSLEARSQLLLADSGFSWLNFAVTLIGAGLLVPMGEEMFFRGALYTWFRRRFPIWAAVLISSTLFALGHADSAGVVASSFILGVLCAYAFEFTRSIWASYTLHALTNSAAIVLAYAALALMQLFPALSGQ